MIITAIKWILVENVSAVLVCAVQCRVCAHQMKNRNKANFMQWFGDRTLLSICNSINPIRSKWMKKNLVSFLFEREKRAKEMRMEVIRFIWMGSRFLCMEEGVWLDRSLSLHPDPPRPKDRHGDVHSSNGRSENQCTESQKVKWSRRICLMHARTLTDSRSTACVNEYYYFSSVP